jgi:hypothetical protein
MLDIHWGFNNIRIKEGDEWKMAFIINRGLYEPSVMYFRMCSAPASFQWMVDIHFRSVLSKGHVFTHVDDVLIVGETLDKLTYWMWETLEIMHESGLSCKPVKCQFEKMTVKYLGTIITEDQITVNPVKVAVIADWPTPRKLRDVESFLRTINFWQKFFKGFSEIMHLLHELKKKDAPFVWTECQQMAFDELKKVLMSAPILKILNWDEVFSLETNTPNYTLGAILLQCHDGKWHPIDFHSQMLIPAEQNYLTHDAELLAIIDLSKKWWHLLKGATHEVLIHTGNAALEYFTTTSLLESGAVMVSFQN